MFAALLGSTILAVAAPDKSSPALDWALHSGRAALVNHPDGAYSETTDTYYSQAIPLKAGHMIYTNPANTPLTMPTGEYAITSFIGDIVDDQHDAVPLSTVYDHHWIAKASTHENLLCKAAPGRLGNYVFGIGAESRNNPVTFPAGFGYEVKPGTTWNANIHLLRTEGLAGDNPHKAAKECNECYYANTKTAQCTVAQNGTFKCCGENDGAGVASCPTTALGQLMPAKNFHLRYTVSYTRNVSSIVPLSVGVMAAPHCAAFYGVQRDDVNLINTQTYQFRLPYDTTTVLATGHVHTGANNISLYLNGQEVCTSVPTYGSQVGVVGDEKGYLVEISQCISLNTTGAVQMKKGDMIRIEGRYYVGSADDRLLYSDGTHLNVMAYMYVAYHRSGAGWERGRPVKASLE